MKNSDYHFYKFLKDNNYPISYEDFSKNINSHPDYPSLLAYSETFSFLGIENLAAQVPKEEYENIPDTFIALIKENNENKFVYVKKQGNEVGIYFNKSKNKLSLNDFFNVWDGIILAIDTNEKIVEKIDTNKVNKYVYIIILLAFIVFLLFSKLTPLVIFNIFLSITGISLAVLTMREELGFEDDQVQKICNTSENSSCNEVIKSDGGKVLNTFSLSDLALSYFVSSLLLNIITSNFYSTFSSLILSILSFFVIVFSIYYQKFVVKRWCILCLGIVTILLLQGMVSIISYDKNYLFLPFILFGLIFLILLSICSLIKPFILRTFQLNKTEIDFLKIKRNKKIFNALLNSSESIKEFDNLDLIRSSSNSEIIGVLSPSCGFCKKAFFDYKNLINNNIECSLIFNINPDNEDNNFLKICYFILDEYNKKGYNHAIKLLDDWYKSSFEVELWLKQHNYSFDEVENTRVYNQLKNMFEWCRSNQINYTPATIYNNKIYPTDLEISDLMFFIE